MIAGKCSGAGAATVRSPPQRDWNWKSPNRRCCRTNEKVVATLHDFRRLGIRTALDDFGTGYSSLSYLRSFPFDKLKIDQSFVSEMATRPDCLAIVNSVAALAQQLGITTTAEGVETLRQLAHVREAGCAEAQGYFFGAPQPLSTLPRWWTTLPPEVVEAA